MLAKLLLSVVAAGIIVASILPAQQEARGRAGLVVVYVIDGLRPDSISAEHTPNLHRLRREGVEYVNSHAAFPTVTRVNSAAISTGTYPQKNGLVGNTMFVPAVDPLGAFNTQNHELLLKMKAASGKLLFVPTVSELLAKNGLRLAAVGSGSPGSTLLLNPAAVDGIGLALNGAMQPPAYPENVRAQVLAKFGPPPRESPAGQIDWTERVFRDYVLAELRPAVAMNWHTQPDSAQHRFGVGSPEALKALRSADGYVGQAIEKLAAAGMAERFNLIVISDHGFALHSHEVNVAGELVRAGLKSAADSDDVVVAGNGQSVSLHVKGSESARIRRICEFLQRQDWVDAIFTAGGKPRPEQGWVPGTFALDLVRLANVQRGPDIVVTLPWSSSPNAAGVIGTQYSTGNQTAGSGRVSADSSTRALAGTGSGHGGLGPAVVRNTFIAWGPAFRRGVAMRAPAGNVDVTPTILALLGVHSDSTFDGRVLSEAFADGPDPEKVVVRVRTVETGNGKGYRAALQVSEAGPHWYVDKAWRVR